MNQYRCETCARKDPHGHGWCRYANEHVNPPRCVSPIAEFTKRCGCASHSDFQSEREKLDELGKFIEENKHGIASLNDGLPFIWFYPLRDKLKELRAGEPDA